MQLPEMPMTFTTKTELPDFEEFVEWYDEYSHEDVKIYTSNWNRYDEAKIELCIENEYKSEGEVRINKLLGYANLVQAGMLLECEVATSGVDLYSKRGGYSENLSKDKLRQLKKDCTKWRLLFQLDSTLYAWNPRPL